MLTINNYIRAASIEEAYQQLTSTKGKAYIIGGGTWLQLGANRRILRAIDLSMLSLDYIIDKGDCWEIGAMTTLNSLALHEDLGQYANSLIAKSVADIGGVQLRNMATVGGAIGGKHGFSDLLTALLALDAKVELFNQGLVSLQNYLAMNSRVRDVIVKVIVPKIAIAGAWQAMRSSKGDFALLNVAIAKGDFGTRVAVGARPQRAILAVGDALDIHFGTNSLASAEYRRQICTVLINRGLTEVAANAN